MKNWLTLFLLAFCLTSFTPSGWAVQKAPAAEAAAKININMASSSELQVLPGIGPATADNIIAFRDARGNFKSPDDLVAVKGVGGKTLEKIRDLITTE